MAKRELQTLIFDIESDGLLPTMTKIHCLAIREYETGQVWRFRKNKKEDTIAKGITMLQKAKVLVGQNIIDFDIPAIQLVFPDFDPVGLIEDTLVYVRLLFANQKDKDFEPWRRGKHPGNLIGHQSLDAWGHRLGLHKGDYKKEMEAKAKALGLTDKEEISFFVWGEWNQNMDDYCLGDIDVNTKLWTHCLAQRFPQGPIDFEHEFHEFACKLSADGFPFDIARAKVLAEELIADSDVLVEQAKEFYGRWFAPGRKHIIEMLWDDPDGKNAKKTYEKPRTEYGEDRSRSIWAEVDVSKRTTAYKSLYTKRTNKKTGVEKVTMNYDKFEDAFVSKVQIKDFKPTSRQMIVDRFTTIYGWEPKEFTDGGAPSVNDDVLQNLIGIIPMAEELAEIFYLSKRVGMIATGPNAWLNQVGEDGAIHHRLNGGGTISGRCSHSFPNVGQVPKVKLAKVFDVNGEVNTKFISGDGTISPLVFDADGEYKKNAILTGRNGDHGWDCRRLFYTPPGWVQVGCDLSGIELRCLASLAAPYDNGYLIDQILNGDIHTANQHAAGLPTRDMAKTFIYALVYGAGDVKIGSIVDPLADEETQRARGKELKESFFSKLPGLAAAVKMIKREAKRGWIEGLDGRRLFVRSPHSALNLRLQSDGAVLAKRWTLIAIDKLLDAGHQWGWDGDFVFMAFVHDEHQTAVKPHLRDYMKELMVQSAKEAGEFYNFGMEVAAESKHGINWSECH